MLLPPTGADLTFPLISSVWFHGRAAVKQRVPSVRISQTQEIQPVNPPNQAPQTVIYYNEQTSQGPRVRPLVMGTHDPKLSDVWTRESAKVSLNSNISSSYFTSLSDKNQRELLGFLASSCTLADHGTHTT